MAKALEENGKVVKLSEYLNANNCYVKAESNEEFKQAANLEDKELGDPSASGKLIQERRNLLTRGNKFTLSTMEHLNLKLIQTHKEVMNPKVGLVLSYKERYLALVNMGSTNAY